MIGNKAIFTLVERSNTFRKSGKEWALNVRIDENRPWTIKSWEKKPSEGTVNNVRDIVMRSFEFYHSHLSIPRFNISQVNS